ncbi:glycosyltransferase [Pseudoxanthomonas putridarboris]|uniref:Glycosyltransferase n=1 Tax=Pseudoxanthomonas putridarboris TaxID=752605 RepID=A0ABU9IUW9_9GAMM
MSLAPSDEFELRLQLLRAQREVGELRASLDSASENAKALQGRLAEMAKEKSVLRASVRFRLGDCMVEGVKLPLKLLRRARNIFGSQARRDRVPDTLLASSPMMHSTLKDGGVGLGSSEDAPLLVDVRPLPSPGPVPSELSVLCIAAVMDPFSVASFSPECRFISLHPNDWLHQIRESRPDLLLVESAWTGLQGEWRGKVERAPSELQSLVASCRAAGIPTIFWNKEDPLHFEAFVETARLFDHVFTTDALSIPKYRRALGHDRVALLPFALQPRTHHPVCSAERDASSVFAGAWYGRMHDRCSDFEAAADALMLAGPLFIHDRHSGHGESHQRFPERFSACIRPGVPFEETPNLYRSHVIGLNLNTIKQSPTMFARRVLELIGCNTSVYGNFSLALRLLLGDLTVSSDDPERLFARAWEELRNPGGMEHRKRRLLALRKVLKEHTWARRLQTISLAAFGRAPNSGYGRVRVVAKAKDGRQLESIQRAFARQQGVDAVLVLALAPGLPLPVHAERLEESPLVPGDWIAMLHPDDYYGDHYLEDLALGRFFGLGSSALGKAAWLERDASGGLKLNNADGEYKKAKTLLLRRSLVRLDRLPGQLVDLLDDLDTASLEGERLVSLDVMSYVENGAGFDFPELETHALNMGIDIGDVEAAVSALEPTPDPSSAGDDAIDGEMLVRLFNNGTIPARTSAGASISGMEICSLLEHGQEDALFSAPIERSRVERAGFLRVGLQAAYSKHLDLYADALDSAGTVLHRLHLEPGVEAIMDPPLKVAHYRLAAAVRGHFVHHVEGLWLTGMPAAPLVLPGRGRLLLVCNGYPERGRLYRNAFLHRRVLAYRSLGVIVDVISVSASEAQRAYEHDGILVQVCSPATLAATIRHSKHAAIAVHFLDRAMWEGLQEAAHNRRVVVWLHGAEIQSPWRRRFNYRADEELHEAIRLGDARAAFWRELLRDPPPGLHLVFVSKTFAEETWTDLGVRCADARWSVIHNPIDTDLFGYQPKPVEQRFHILSIRPHDYRIYANDLVAQAIHALSQHDLFGSLNFTLVGDGALWDENFGDLRQYPNVSLHRRFLRQEEIASLHRQHGVFLVPTRGDTQGVSRDEAMSSGLVPVTARIGAIPEFVDDESGILCPVDDPNSFAAAIIRLAEEPAMFARLSRGASQRVRNQAGSRQVVSQELQVLGLAGIME